MGPRRAEVKDYASMEKKTKHKVTPLANVSLPTIVPTCYSGIHCLSEHLLNACCVPGTEGMPVTRTRSLPMGSRHCSRGGRP